MGKFDGVLICTDFDETYYTADKRVPQANLDALAYFQAQGGRFTVATGRAHTTFAPYLHLAPVNAPVILSNGAQLYDFQREEMLLDVMLPDSCGEDLTAFMAGRPEVGLETYNGEQMYLFQPNFWTGYHMNKVGITGIPAAPAEAPRPWGKAILMADPEILAPVREAFLNELGNKYEAIFSNSHMLEITAKGCNKGGMALELARRLGVARKDLYCVGDNQNDLPMLEVSAVPFAPAGCAQAVKDAGAVLLPPCEAGTIAGLVKYLDERY